jgi:hypothetical protein
MNEVGQLTPTNITRAGRMLLAGSLIATVTSKRTGQHVTLRLKASRKDTSGGPTWPRVPFEDATHVFIDDYDGERVATFYPQKGKLWLEAGTTAAVQWTVVHLLRFLAGKDPAFEAQAELAEADLCGRCGRELTDPVSIERGLGPDCFGALTGSEAVAVWQEPLPL